MTPQVKVFQGGVDIAGEKRATVRVEPTRHSIVITLKNARASDKGNYVVQLLAEGNVCDKTNFDLNVIEEYVDEN